MQQYINIAVSSLHQCIIIHQPIQSIYPILPLTFLPIYFHIPTKTGRTTQGQLGAMLTQGLHVWTSSAVSGWLVAQLCNLCHCYLAVCVDHISIKRHRICKSKWNVDDDHGDLSASEVSTDGERSFKSHRLL